jgi:hypothetical protein
VKGSHGRRTGWDEDGPVFISRQKHLVPTLRITSVDVHDLILGHLNQRFQLPASSSQLRYD